jgi:hypothetical protein
MSTIHFQYITLNFEKNPAMWFDGKFSIQEALSFSSNVIQCTAAIAECNIYLGQSSKLCVLGIGVGEISYDGPNVTFVGWLQYAGDIPVANTYQQLNLGYLRVLMIAECE